MRNDADIKDASNSICIINIMYVNIREIKLVKFKIEMFIKIGRPISKASLFNYMHCR